ncbi:MAG: ribokinase [Pseudomonadota bacterium]
MTGAAVTVVGSVNVDYSMRVPTLPQHGQTLAGNDFDICLGGKGANQAVAASRLGAATRLIACVGDDAGGQQALAAFADDGLDTQGVVTDGEAHTGSALIFVDDAGENCIGVSPGANARLRPEHIESHSAALAGSHCLLLQLETPPETVLRAAQLARAGGCRVILNPAPLRGPLADTLLAEVDMATPNAHEAADLTGVTIRSPDDAERAARALLDRGPRAVVITLGAQGALALTEAGVEHVPAPNVDAIDTVGAGDTFNGALAVALARGDALSNALRFAVTAASLSTLKRGAQPSIPRLDAVEAALG